MLCDGIDTPTKQMSKGQSAPVCAFLDQFVLALTPLRPVNNMCMDKAKHCSFKDSAKTSKCFANKAVVQL